MAIRDKKREQEVREFDPVRVYTDTELRDFHKKIQKFYEPRTIINPTFQDFNETHQIFNYDKFGVAFGALVERKGSFGAITYAVVDSSPPTRYEKMWVLLHQYEDWQKKQDWIENKRNEELEKVAEEVPF